MEIQISSDAAGRYRGNLSRFSPINWEWNATMEIIAGHRLVVETDYLFSDQYNTAPVSPEIVDLWIGEYHDRIGDYLFNIRKDNEIARARESLIKTGLRIMDHVVDYVIEDIRPSKRRCNWCGKISDRSDPPTCPHCQKSEYIENFDRAYFVRYPNGRGDHS